jgi:IPT/TIG domain
MRHGYLSVLVVAVLLVGMLSACGSSDAPNFPAPTLTAVSPARGPSPGGRTITLTGTGFSANGAGGTNTIMIGGTAATNVITVNDDTLMCDTPAGTEGARDVVVSNTNGMATLVGAYHYVDLVLYAATARSGSSSQPGSFYRINPANGAGTLVGATDDVMTGIAFDSTFTTMFGINTSPFAGQSIFTVDVTTGAMTLVGATGTPPNNNVGDLTFVGSLLVGNSYVGEFCSFDQTTGAATLIGSNGNTFQGLAIAADAAQTLYFSYGSRILYTIDPADGALTTIAPLSGDIGANEILAAMTFLDGVLYAVTAEPGMIAARLVTVDPTTAVVTFVGDMPEKIDALEGNIR